MLLKAVVILTFKTNTIIYFVQIFILQKILTFCWTAFNWLFKKSVHPHFFQNVFQSTISVHYLMEYYFTHFKFDTLSQFFKQWLCQSWLRQSQSEWQLYLNHVHTASDLLLWLNMLTACQLTGDTDNNPNPHYGTTHLPEPTYQHCFVRVTTTRCVYALSMVCPSGEQREQHKVTVDIRM